MTGSSKTLAMSLAVGLSLTACTTDNTYIVEAPDAAGGQSDAHGDAPVTSHDGGAHDGASDGGVDGRPSEASTDGGVDAPRDVFTCDPMKGPSEQSCIISETYGVFVATAGNGGSDTGGTGTRTAPYASVTHALANLKGLGRVFVCNGAYTDQITVGGAVSIYGGLTCGTPDSGVVGAWAYVNGTKGVVTASSPSFALRVTAGSGAVDIEDMEFDGIAGTSAVPTSIGALVLSSTDVTMSRVTLTSGTGLTGTMGTTVSNYAGVQATQGNAASGATGGLSLTCTCGDSSMTTGGTGGAGSSGSPGGGGGGSPLITGAPVTDGAGGVYDTGDGTCQNGGPGAPSPNGPGGTGATSAGTLGTSGWTLGPVGTAGTNAGPAQGGGGGSGGVYIAVPSGGGGGGACGGCGGGGGTGGGPGGSSFALASAGSVVTLNACSLTAGSGGMGGQGGPGQSGEPGGTSGVQSANGCQGGKGGAGGTGGGGGGGAGGHSIAIAYSGTQPTTPNGTMAFFATTAAGGGGAGTPAGTTGTGGSAGLFAASMSF